MTKIVYSDSAKGTAFIQDKSLLCKHLHFASVLGVGFYKQSALNLKKRISEPSTQPEVEEGGF